MKKLIAFFYLTLSLHAQASNPKKIVLITGASKGLGLVTAQTLAQAGHMVYGAVRKESDKEELTRINTTKNLTFIVLDVTDESSIKSAVSCIIQEQGCIDVLINNACEVTIGTCETCTIQEQQRTMDINYFGVVRMLQEVVPHMRKNKKGHIINISSIAGFTAFPIIETYVASKFALEGLSASLAQYLNRWNINVSVIEPAGVKTQVAFSSAQGSRQDQAEYFNEFCAAGQQGMKESFDFCQAPEEVAAVIADVIDTQNPQLRYQTNTISADMAKNYFVDPQGLTTLEKQRNGRKKLFDLLKEHG